jgi:pimeloyl-ACP methyl ester carboxylesterase
MKKLTLKCKFGKIKGLVWGSGNPHKILALHGWLDNAASFCQLAPKLANQGYEVVAIDFPGHGKSDHKAKGHFVHFVDFVLDVQNVIDELKWNKVTLLGHSMGAGMAQLYAITCPEKVEKLIMIENLGPVPAYQPGTVAENLSEALSQWKKHTTKHKRFYANVDEALKTRLKVTPMQPDILKPMVKRGLKKTEKGYHWRTDKRLRLRSLIRFSEEMVQDALSSKKPPTQLILASSQTYALNYPSSQRRREKLQAQSFVEINGHHHLHMDNAEEVFEAIKSFLESI